MGIYLNPPPRDTPDVKELWLTANAKLITLSEAMRADCDNDRETVVVCLVDNGGFTAAGVAYSNRERDAFAYPDDRDRFWFKVSVDKLGPDVGLSPGFPAEYRDKSRWGIE